MTIQNEIAAERQQVFTALTNLLLDWRANDRKTTTAGVTSALIKSGSLDLERLGFPSNAAFWEAAEEVGVIHRERLETGHWLVLLPGESFAGLPSASPSDTRATLVERGVRLRSDLWAAFVDWDTDYRRFWDRDHRRVFFSPAAPGWVPPFLGSRFIEIAPALQGTQIEWMKSFAELKPEEPRKRLIESLQADAPRGAFSKVLLATGFQFEWHNTLRSRIVERATNWARDAEIDIESIFEPARAAGSISASRPAQATGARTTGSRSRVSLGDQTPKLRAKVHRAVEVMTWDDLSNIPLRGEHLLGF